MSYLWKCSRSCWTGLWETWSSWRCPCSLHRVWTRWPLKAPFNPKHSMILWFSEKNFHIFVEAVLYVGCHNIAKQFFGIFLCCSYFLKMHCIKILRIVYIFVVVVVHLRKVKPKLSGARPLPLHFSLPGWCSIWRPFVMLKTTCRKLQ